MKNHCSLYLIGVFLFLSLASFSQKTYTISGNMKDKSNGETLIGASIYVKETGSGVVTNVYGFYSLSLKAGTYHIKYSYIGYEAIEKTIELKENLKLSMELNPTAQQLSEVVITEKRTNQQVTKNEIGSVTMNIKTIRQIPVLMGEVDIIKAIQLLPGVMSTSEGGSGFSVRGGAPDQNLIILDEATVYNASHALGFFSVFNNDAIKDVTIYKGDIPVQYGGRLSSVLDVRMNDGNSKQWTATGGIGLLSSRVTLEGPIIKDKTSMLLSGRRTYFDIFLPLANNEGAKNAKLYFWDLNAKIAHQFNEKNRLYLSAYGGKDVFGMRSTYMQADYGNKTGSIRWNHLFSDKLFSNVTLIASEYDYLMGMESGGLQADWTSDLIDYGAKMDFTWFANERNTVRFGASSTYHIFKPGTATYKLENSEGWFDSDIANKMKLENKYALENAIYLGNEQKITKKLSLKYGLRLSAFSNIGKDTVYYFDKDYNVTDVVGYDKGEFYHTYWNLEPRFGAVYLLNESTSLKANYTRTAQYIQLAQNSNGGNPLDVWFPANPTLEPQMADQFALGFAKNLKDNEWETTAEVYYKKIYNCIDFKDHSNVMMNPRIYEEIRTGSGQAYGLELMLKKPAGIINGWISYTLSRSERTIPQINEGKTYLAPYDRTHNLTIVATYNLNPRNIFSANFVYYTGNAVTFPTGKAIIDGIPLPVYSDKNSYRMPDYHRLDLSYTLKGKERPNQFWSWDLNFSVYNVYGRKNPWMINFKQDPDDPSLTYAEMTYLFSVVPSVTFNFKANLSKLFSKN